LLEGNEEKELREAKELDCEGIAEEDNGEISIHALKGIANNKIIKVDVSTRRDTSLECDSGQWSKGVEQVNLPRI